jgi:iron complex outermembrane receptor protein
MRKIRHIIIFVSLILYSVSVLSQVVSRGIRGRVTDQDGNGLAGCSITIEKSFLGVHSESDGNYSFSGLKDGTYSIHFSFLGYEPAVSEVNLNGETILDVKLIPRPFLTEEILISGTRAGEHSPLAYSSISGDLLKKQNTGQDMPYLLSLTPSLVETSESGNGVGYTSLRIRGTDGNRINVTIDGIPLNDPESQQVFWVDLPDLASSVENIQVQRGAGTSSNGAGAFGATISVQTANIENEPFAEVASSVGSFNTMKNMVSAGTGLLGGKFALQMRYSDLKSDGYVDRTGSDHRSAFITGIYRTERSRLKANIILGEEHTGIGWWGVPKDSLESNRKYNPTGEYTDEAGNTRYYNNESDNYVQNHFQLIYSLKISESLSLNTAFHYTMGKGYYEEYRAKQPYSDYGLSSLNIGDSIISETDLIRRKWMSNDFYGAVYSLKYKNDRVEAVAGGGINLYKGDHFGTIIWMKNAGDAEKDHRWYLNNSTKGEVSFYGKVNYTLSDKISMFGDLQYRKVYYRMNGPDDDFKDISQNHSFDFLNPKAGLFYSVSQNQDAYISFSVANREPTRSDYKEASGDASATPKPETLYDTELGYNLRTGRSKFSVNLYGMFYIDQLVPTGELSNVGYSIMTNVDKSYRMGIELSAGIRLAEYVNWNINMTLSRNRIINFTEHYTDYNTTDWTEQYLSKNLGDVNIAYSPSQVMSSDFDISVLKDVNLHLISKYVGKQYFDNTMNRGRTIDPYFVNNIRVDIAPRIKNLKRLDLQFMVNNIFNVKYENNAYGGNWYEDGNEKTWSYYFPQAGTNFMFRLGVKF